MHWPSEAFTIRGPLWSVDVSHEVTIDGWDHRHAEIVKREGAYLPHWSSQGAAYAVTFRLADSLPSVVLEGFRRERDEIILRARAAGRELTQYERLELRDLHSEKVEAFLDAGHGACVLRDARAARIMKDAIQHFDGQRYHTMAWCVMPNHVHAVLTPAPGHELFDILHSWKSFTANKINRILSRTGALWQPEPFDHLIRDADELERSIRYVLNNPRAIGLINWPWCGTTFASVGDDQGQDTRSAEN
jgi:menaquinone-specific isochorismate synthase